MIGRRGISFVVITCLSFMTSRSFAALSFLELDTVGKKKLGRIGEIHRPLYRPDEQGACVEERDKAAVMNMVTELSQSKEPVHILIEVPQWRCAGLRQYATERHQAGYEIGLLDSLALFSEEHNGQFGSVSFGYADNMRGPALYEIIQIWSFFNKQFFADFFVAPLKELLGQQLNTSGVDKQIIRNQIDGLSKNPDPTTVDNVLKANPQLKADCFNLFIPYMRSDACRLKLSDYSVHDFFEEIDRAKEGIGGVLSMFDPGSQQYNIVYSHLQLIDEAQEKARNFYNSYLKEHEEGEKGSCFDGFLNALEATESFSRVWTRLNEWVDPLVRYIADASFFIETFKAFQSYDNVICISGNRHAINLQSVCTCLNMMRVFTEHYFDDRVFSRLQNAFMGNDERSVSKNPVSGANSRASHKLAPARRQPIRGKKKR